jgi:hypothetical protein
MHMLPIATGMHMHPVLRIRFDPVAPIPAPMACGWNGTKRTEADIGAERGEGDDYGYKKRQACSAARRVAF